MMQAFSAYEPSELCGAINEFSKHHDVFATQTHVVARTNPATAAQWIEHHAYVFYREKK